MKKFLLFFCFATCFNFSNAQTTYTAVKSGSWSDPTVWDKGTVPTGGANVIIPAGLFVNTVGLGGTSSAQEMTDSIHTITVSGTLTLGVPSSISSQFYDFIFDYAVTITVKNGGTLKDSTAESQSYNSGSGTPEHDFAFAYRSTDPGYDSSAIVIDVGGQLSEADASDKTTYIYGQDNLNYNVAGGASFSQETGPLNIRIDGYTGDVTSSNIVTAIRLINFTGTYQPDNGVQLQWTTASELNNAYFAVQRSVDGREFENIGKVPGAGTSLSPNNYTFSDGAASKLGSDILYYRLQQFDFNGYSTYSNVLAIHISDEPTLKLWPNPNNGQFTLSFGKIPQQMITVRIVNANGQLISQQTYQQSQTTINLSGNPKGVYFVQILYKNGPSKVLQAIVQ